MVVVVVVVVVVAVYYNLLTVDFLPTTGSRIKSPQSIRGHPSLIILGMVSLSLMDLGRKERKCHANISLQSQVLCTGDSLKRKNTIFASGREEVEIKNTAQPDHLYTEMYVPKYRNVSRIKST